MPCSSRIATRKILNPESLPFEVKRTEPSAPTAGLSRFVDSCHRHTRVPSCWFTVSDCSIRLTPKVIDSVPNAVGRLTPCSNLRHEPVVDLPNASDSATFPDATVKPPCATSSFAPSAGLTSDAAGCGRPNDSATNDVRAEPPPATVNWIAAAETATMPISAMTSRCDRRTLVIAELRGDR